MRRHHVRPIVSLSLGLDYNLARNHGVSHLKRGGGRGCTCRQYTRDYLNGRVITFLVSPAINTL